MRHDWGGLTVLALALGLVLAVNVVTAAVLYDAIFSQGPGLSDNATQLLTAAFGGIIGVVGAYTGFRVGQLGSGNASANQAPQVGRGEEQGSAAVPHDEPHAD